MHEPGDDKYGYEKASERWLPVHTVETILLSVISMLADPNYESPANVDAAVIFFQTFLCEIILVNFVKWAEGMAREPDWVQAESGAMCAQEPGGALSLKIRLFNLTNIEFNFKN